MKLVVISVLVGMKNQVKSYREIDRHWPAHSSKASNMNYFACCLFTNQSDTQSDQEQWLQECAKGTHKIKKNKIVKVTKNRKITFSFNIPFV